MMRRRASSAPYAVVLVTPTAAVAVHHQSRDIRTLSMRDREVIGMPAIHQQYQRMTNHPMKQSGIQFNTHYSSHHRARCNADALVDWMHWGKETGLAYAPHRNQRVAFDHHDSLQPTSVPSTRGGVWSQGQDPSSTVKDTADDFKPKGYAWNEARNANSHYTAGRPWDSDIRLPRDWESESGYEAFLGATDGLNEADFGALDGELKETHTAVPGIHRPFRGEQDRKMMQAMAVRATETADTNAVVASQGQYTRHVFLNRPHRDNCVDETTAKDLGMTLQRATTALRTKMAVLTGAQSGETDAFSGGLDFEQLAFYKRMEHQLRSAAEALRSTSSSSAEQPSAPTPAKGKKGKKGAKSKATPAADATSAASQASPFDAKLRDVQVQRLLKDADRYAAMFDDTLRAATTLLWRTFAAQRPLLTIINGRCNNFGIGLGLLTQYACLRDSSEFIHDGPAFGATPSGGLTHLLARPESTLKYPGVAEYVMLSGMPLYAGDALRLGWSDLFSTLPDLNYHVREWFNSTEHLHPDAVTWQIGHLVDTTMSMKDQHSAALERCALSPTRARWVEETFADQPSVDAVMNTLGAVEKLPLDDPNNTTDGNLNTMSGTLHSVADGARKLESLRLHFTLTPWESAMPPAEFKSIGDVFRSYTYETNMAGRQVFASAESSRAAEWHAQRRKEFEQYRQQRLAPHGRHLHVTLEGCEHKRVSFEFDFVDCDESGNSVPYAPDAANPGALLERLTRAINTQLGFSSDRGLAVFWQLPTLDTCRVFNDAELLEALRSDPGVDNPENPTRLPPFHIQVTRSELHLSEWAYAVKHQLLLSSPFALKASWALLGKVRGDGSPEGMSSVSQALGLEFRYLTRLTRRPDFHAVGVPSQQDEDAWTTSRDERDVSTSLLPLRPNPSFDEVFERDVTIDGHHFKVRPRWSPRTLADVSDAEVAALGQELDFVADGVTDIHVPTEADIGTRVADTVLEVNGYEVVPELGSGSERAPAPLKSDAKVPTNVDFYAMARHPFKDQATSWRSHGFTKGSEAYFKQKYEEAVRDVHDPAGEGVHAYWAPGNAAGERREAPEEVLLRDRFWGAVNDATSSVEEWARDAKANAEAGGVNYSLEAATTDEKIYDDHYYRWFITSGQSPNPSGLTIPAKAKSSD